MSIQEERLLTFKEQRVYCGLAVHSNNPEGCVWCERKRLIAQDVKSYAAGVDDMEARNKLLIEALEQCILAFHLTREYVGTEMLPAIEGWSWYDAVLKAEALL